MNWSMALREELRQRAEAWAVETGLPVYRSRGRLPVVLFEALADGSALGNFEQQSWRAVQKSTNWQDRLQKKHSSTESLPPEKAPHAKELDSCNSSDALLMNCFCHPGTSARLLQRLGLPLYEDDPEFGYKAQVALKTGRGDSTEVDMRVGSLLVEAKLTENDFTSRPSPHVERYAAFERVFDVKRLPVDGQSYAGYQLIRNVLAAYQHKANLCVFLDQRRPDLLQEWWAVHAAIRSGELRERCGFRTWQQVRAESPPRLACFLEKKYGL